MIVAFCLQTGTPIHYFDKIIQLGYFVQVYFIAFPSVRCMIMNESNEYNFCKI